MNSNKPSQSFEQNDEEICQEFWQEVLLQLEKDIPQTQFRTWVQPLECLGLDAKKQKVLIAAPNRFKLDFAKKQFASVIHSIAQKFWPSIDLSFGLYKENSKPLKDSQNLDLFDSKDDAMIRINARIKATQQVLDIDDEPNLNVNQELNPQLEIEDPKIKPKNKAIATTYDQTKLNRGLTFNTFVEGQANMLARSAAIQIATQPNRAYNPCYFYGGVGLGKTHLMHAIGNHFYQKNKPKIKYIHAEQFVSDVVKSYQRKSYDDLKNSYHNLDLLLIDDIQFLSGKSRTQEEFFYVFESLISKRAQIVLTSDTYPRDLKDMDDRLISRFSSGLLVAIEPPELEMRVEILKSKARLEKFDLDDEVAFFVAKNLVNNIRELEGALRKLMAYSMFHNLHIDIDIARKALKDILPEMAVVKTVNIEYIQKIVCSFYGINITDMSSRKRTANINKPRQIAMFFAKEFTKKSLPEIGNMFGGRDHSTILHAVRKITKEQKTIEQLAKEINAIRQSLLQ